MRVCERSFRFVRFSSHVAVQRDMSTDYEICEDRPLSRSEYELVEWLLRHGESKALVYAPQLEGARVISRCSCGCDSVNFAIDGVVPAPGAMGILADYEWRESTGALNGIYLFERDGLLAGLDVWSQDGLSVRVKLPQIDEIVPIGTLDIQQT